MTAQGPHALPWNAGNYDEEQPAGCDEHVTNSAIPSERHQTLHQWHMKLQALFYKASSVFTKEKPAY